MAESLVRIAFCITELDPGGAERALVRIVTGLDRRRWQPHVYCLAERGPLAANLEEAEIPLTCLNARSWRDVAVAARLAAGLKAFQPHILQTFMFHGNLIGRLAAKWAKVSIVVAGVRVVEPDARWRMRLDRWTNCLVDRTICVSRGVADHYRSLGYREDQLAVVPNGVDVERFTTANPADLTAFGIPDGAQTIISVGRLHPQKGQRHLLSAFERIRNRPGCNRNVHLLLVGDGPDREALESTVRERNLNECVHFAGWQPDTAPLLRAADLFVLSSVWEGMPNALLEAMAAGLPCVATNVEGVRELVIDGETGLMVEPGNPQSLSQAIDRLLCNSAFAAQLAAAGQTHVRDHFSWERTIRGFESNWEELLRDNARVRFPHSGGA